MRKISCLVIILLFCLSSILPMVNSIYVEKSTDTLENVLDNGSMDSAWPMFGHDIYHAGRSPYGTYGNSLIEKWRIQLADWVAFSSPVIDNDGIIYIGTVDGTLHAINPDGTEKWRFTTTGSMDSRMTTPAIDKDGTIYVTIENGYLLAINQNGTEKWRTRIKDFVISSPTIANDGTIFIAGYNKFYAIYPNGTIKWDFSTGDAIKATPTIDKNGFVYVSSHDGYLYSFYPSNGTLRWKLRIGSGTDCYCSPTIDDNGIIYIGSWGPFYAIYSNGTIKWKNTGGGCYYGGPSIGYDGTIYAAGGDRLQAFSPEGEKKFDIWLGEDMPSPAIANNSMIFAAGGKGHGMGSNKIYMISPYGEEICSLILEGDKPYAGCTLGSSPTIGTDGTLYIGSWFHGEVGFDGYLHAISTTIVHKPSKPTIKGPDLGYKDVEYTYSASCFHLDGYNVSYFFDWGDGTNSSWTDFVPPRIPVNASHTWIFEGEQKDFGIRVKAKDIYGAESEWATLKVWMPKTHIHNPIIELLLRIVKCFPFFEKILNQMV